MRRLFFAAVILFCSAACAQGQGAARANVSGGAAAGWTQVAGTSISGLCPTYPDIQGSTGCAAVESAWGSAAVDNTRNAIVIHNGGHVDYDGTETYRCALTSISAGTCSLFSDSAHGSAYDSVVTACGEDLASPLTPTSRHNYSGFWYLPNQDRYFLYGAGIASCGNFSDANWVQDPTTGAWTSLAPATHPSTAGNGSIPLAGYNPNDGCLYFLENNVPNFWKQCYDAFGSTSWTQLTGPSGAPCDSTNASSAIDVSRQLFVCAGGGNLYTIALSTSATTNDTAASGCSTAAAATSPGIAYDPVQQLVVFWFGGSSVLTYNATTHKCQTVTFSGGPGAQLANGTFNRFQYMPGIGAFVLANGISSNLWTLQMVAPATAANQDFANRAAASGVVLADQLSASANLPQRTCADSDSGLYPDSCPGGSTYAAVDGTTYRSNGGSAIFTIPGMSGSEPAGYYRRLFATSQSAVPGTNDANLTRFGAGSDFYISYAQRMDSAFINDVASTGSTATYPKQQIISWSGSTCGALEITTVNDNNEGYPLSYSNCGATPFQVSSSLTGSGIFNEFNRQLISSGSYSGTPSYTLTGGSIPSAKYNCPYSSSQPNGNCFDYPVNTWATYYYHVHIGTFGSANSTVEGFVSTPSSPAWRQWLYFTNLTISLDAGNTWGFDMVTLIPYWTGRSASVCSSPCSTAHTWYNELIVSSGPILPPQAPPAAP